MVGRDACDGNGGPEPLRAKGNRIRGSRTRSSRARSSRTKGNRIKRLAIGGLLGALLGGIGVAAPGLAQAYVLAGEPRACSSGQLRVQVRTSTVGPTRTEYRLQYTNKSTRQCALRGFPTLEFRAGRHVPLVNAVPDPVHANAPTVILSAGRSAYSTFTVERPDQTCRPAPAAEILVHLPVAPRAGTAAGRVHLVFTGTVCTDPKTAPVTGPALLTSETPPGA
jgi:hypothetical protein